MPKHITILYFGTLLAHSFVILMMKKVSSKLKNGGEDMKTKYIFLLSAMVIVLGLTGCDSKQTIVVTAVADEVEIPAGEDSIEIDVLANDSAIVDGYHDASTALYLGDIVIQPEHGSVTKNGNTVVYVTHADSEAISDQFTYEAVVDDNEGTKIKDIASVEISIQQDVVVVPPTEPEVTNNVPTANAGSDVSVEVNMPITLTGSASSDSDGSIVAYEWKEGSTVLSTAMSFDYTPTTVETHTILLTVTDDDSAIGTDEVVVTVTEPEDDPNTKPVVSDRTIEMHTCNNMGEDNAYTFTLTGEDDDGDSLTFTKVPDPTYGSIIINEDTGKGKYWLNNSEDQGNCWEGTPNSFTFKVNDSTVDSDSATVTVILDLPPS